MPALLNPLGEDGIWYLNTFTIDCFYHYLLGIHEDAALEYECLN
jgi:hypothetical protein